LVKIFLSSQDDQDIVIHLQSYPNLELSSDKNRDNIKSFVTAETEDLIKKRKLLRSSKHKEQLGRLIIEEVMEGARSMSVYLTSPAMFVSPNMITRFQ